MSGWMKEDGVLSSFRFNVFSDSLQIRSPYAPPFKPLRSQRLFYSGIGVFSRKKLQTSSGEYFGLRDHHLIVNVSSVT